MPNTLFLFSVNLIEEIGSGCLVDTIDAYGSGTDPSPAAKFDSDRTENLSASVSKGNSAEAKKYNNLTRNYVSTIGKKRW